MNIEKLLSIPRSLIINIILFGGGGYRCPLLISNKVKCIGLKKNRVKMDYKHFGSVEVGFQGIKGIRKDKGFLIIQDSGEIYFKGKARIAAGSSIRVDNGQLIIGDNFSCGNNCFLSCSEGIEIGSEALLGWNVNVRDSDGHTVICENKASPSRKKVFIGRHVWIAANVDILKGSVIPDNSIIGYRSCVLNAFSESNILIGGYPAKVLRHNVEWLK